MQLNDILEEHSIKGISKKTNISEENLQYLFNAQFETLKKIKTLGFISIVEREYDADLSALRQKAAEYYREHEDARNFSAGLTVVEEEGKKPIVLVLFVLVMLGLATWYFFTKFDKNNLSTMLPFSQTQQMENIVVPSLPKEQEDAQITEDNVVEENATDSDVILVETVEDTEIPNENNTTKER